MVSEWLLETETGQAAEPEIEKLEWQGVERMAANQKKAKTVKVKRRAA